MSPLASAATGFDGTSCTKKSAPLRSASGDGAGAAVVRASASRIHARPGRHLDQRNAERTATPLGDR
jgi:hypothetical protein